MKTTPAPKPVRLSSALMRRKHLSAADARDQTSEFVRQILWDLRKDKTAELPGIGRLVERPNSVARSGKTAPTGNESL